jgi:hypothetical protein
MAMKRVAKAAWVVAMLLGSSVAHAQHGNGPDEEGTPDPQPRHVELEARPVPGFDRQADSAPARVLQRPPRTLPYYDFAPIPWGYRLKMGSGRFNLLMIGTIALGVGQLASQLSSIAVAASCGNDFRVRTPDCGKHVAELEIPVVGPWFAFAGHGASEPKWVYPFLGGIQAIGLLMVLTGATLDDKRLERDDRFFPLSREVSVVPTVAPGNYGLGLRAAF